MFKRLKNTRPKLVWFIPRPQISPPEDALKLGDIIKDPFDPTPAVNRLERVPIPDNLLLDPVEIPDVSHTIGKSKARGIGLFASYLGNCGIELETDVSNDHSETYTAEFLRTTDFEPDDDYINKCFETGRAKNLMTGHHVKSLYMITGLALAYGATKVVENINKKGLHGLLGVDIAAANLSLGPKGHLSTGLTLNSSAGKRNFVFGYQLIELKWNKKSQQVTHEKHTGGELYSDFRDAQPVVEDVAIGSADIDVEEILIDDFSGVNVETVIENGEEVVAILCD